MAKDGSDKALHGAVLLNGNGSKLETCEPKYRRPFTDLGFNIDHTKPTMLPQGAVTLMIIPARGL